MSIWDATRYGWSPIYWLTVEGIPVVWTERATGLTLPTGYTSESAVLSLQEAGIGIEYIDRQRGVASTAPFGFTLLDATTTHAYLRRWDQETFVSADISATALTIDVADTTGFAASGSIHIGRELVTYSGTTATSFTGCTRGICGYAYAHKMGTSDQTVTDRPRYWLGREVTLWATPMDQGGAVPSTTLEAGAVQVWKGRITGLPQRRRDGFAFACEQLDRLLDGALAGKITGEIIAAGGYYAVDLSDKAVIVMSLTDAAAVSTNYTAVLDIWLGSGKANGDYVTGAEIRTQVSAAWSAWVIGNSLTAVFGDLKWYKSLIDGLWNAAVVVKANLAVEGIAGATEQPMYGATAPAPFPSGLSSDIQYGVGWAVADNPMDPQAQSVGLVVQLDDGLAADVTAPGLLRVTIGKSMTQFAYDFVIDSGAHVYFGTTGKSAFPFKAQGVIGAQCYVAQDSTGPYAELMLRALETSGVSGLRGVYDTLQRGLGYAIDETVIDSGTFTAEPLLQFDGIYEPDGRTFAEVFGGALSLYRKAVAGRVDNGTWLLRLVNTAAGGTDDGGEITDDSLMSHAGDPVESVERALSPNSVTVVVSNNDGEFSLIYNSLADIEATGKRDAEYGIAAVTKSDVTESAGIWVLAGFASDHTAQAAKIRVGPWVSAQPGDVVYLDGLTHPALWDWANGTEGYTGTARVVGRIMDPVSLRVTLTVLLSGGVNVSSLCPSANVLSWTGTAGNPTTINVSGEYYSVFVKCVPCDVIHYRAGSAESTGERYTISAVASAGGETVLTVGGITGVHTLDASLSYLTWPTTAVSSTAQNRFTHVDDGSSWG